MILDDEAVMAASLSSSSSSSWSSEAFQNSFWPDRYYYERYGGYDSSLKSDQNFFHEGDDVMTRQHYHYHYHQQQPPQYPWPQTPRTTTSNCDNYSPWHYYESPSRSPQWSCVPPQPQPGPWDDERPEPEDEHPRSAVVAPVDFDLNGASSFVEEQTIAFWSRRRFSRRAAIEGGSADVPDGFADSNRRDLSYQQCCALQQRLHHRCHYHSGSRSRSPTLHDEELARILDHFDDSSVNNTNDRMSASHSSAVNIEEKQNRQNMDLPVTFSLSQENNIRQQEQQQQLQQPIFYTISVDQNTLALSGVSPGQTSTDSGYTSNGLPASALSPEGLMSSQTAGFDSAAWPTNWHVQDAIMSQEDKSSSQSLNQAWTSASGQGQDVSSLEDFGASGFNPAGTEDIIDFMDQVLNDFGGLPSSSGSGLDRESRQANGESTNEQRSTIAIQTKGQKRPRTVGIVEPRVIETKRRTRNRRSLNYAEADDDDEEEDEEEEDRSNEERPKSSIENQSDSPGASDDCTQQHGDNEKPVKGNDDDDDDDDDECKLIEPQGNEIHEDNPKTRAMISKTHKRGRPTHYSKMIMMLREKNVLIERSKTKKKEGPKHSGEKQEVGLQTEQALDDPDPESDEDQVKGTEWLVCQKVMCCYWTKYPDRMKRHLSWHKDDQSSGYKCPDCGREFYALARVLRHDRVQHTGIKDYECRICEKEVTDIGGHMKLHQESKEYFCYKCKHHFRHKSSFIRHMFRHNGEDLHMKCPVCPSASKTYKTHEELQDHLKKVHPNHNAATTCSNNAGGVPIQPQPQQPQIIISSAPPAPPVISFAPPTLPTGDLPTTLIIPNNLWNPTKIGPAGQPTGIIDAKGTPIFSLGPMFQPQPTFITPTQFVQNVPVPVTSTPVHVPSEVASNGQKCKKSAKKKTSRHFECSKCKRSFKHEALFKVHQKHCQSRS